MEKKVAWLYITSALAMYFFIGYLLLVIKSPAQSLGNLGLDALVLFVLLSITIWACPLVAGCPTFKELCSCSACGKKK